jgi:DNA-binding transcriptional LysR family regulator
MGDALGRLTIHHLRVFLAVAHHRSFTKAAGELGLTQAAVSAQIRDMARILGAPLFEVLGRKVALTHAGEDLEPRAAAAVGLFAEIGEHFTALRGAGAGRIRIGASSSVGTYVLPDLLATFEKSYPGVEITLEILNSALIEDRVVANDFDLGFVGHPPASADLEGEQFLEDEIFFAAAPDHPLARRAKVHPAQIVGERLIVREPGSGTRRTMEEHLQGLGLVFPRVLQLGAVEAVKQAVMSGLGISYFSALTVRRELREKRLVRLPIRSLMIPRCFLFVHRRDKRLTPALSAFLDFLRDQPCHRE